MTTMTHGLVLPGQIGDYERGHRRDKSRRPVSIPQVVELACEALLARYLHDHPEC